MSEVLDTSATPGDRERARREADYLDGVLMTLAWVYGERPETPVSHAQAEVTSRTLKRERLHSEDAIQQGADQPAAGRPLRSYGEGVQSTISWLLGDSTVPLIPLRSRLQGPLVERPLGPAVESGRRAVGTSTIVPVTVAGTSRTAQTHRGTRMRHGSASRLGPAAPDESGVVYKGGVGDGAS